MTPATSTVLTEAPEPQIHAAFTPQVSVIIPSYNHARFVGDAIQSVLAQTEQCYEIIVVDDGSTDDTRKVVREYPGVKYVHQRNQGLSAARNTGMQVSRGQYLLFLDADDCLTPRAIESALHCFAQHPECAFVSGRHVKTTPDGTVIQEREVPSPTRDHYLALLRGNYIGMHATVVYRRDILMASGGFQVGLPACEDYDVYLRLAHKHPVATHDEIMADYRIHESNMSRDIGLMLPTVLSVLRRQSDHVQNDATRAAAYREGMRNWREYYGKRMLASRSGNVSNGAVLRILARHAPGFLGRTLWSAIRRRGKQVARALLPRTVRRRFRGILGRPKTPAVGEVQFGDWRRLTPISRRFGYDRGVPIDRYYIERFLEARSSDIRGRVLEVGDDEYTRNFGGARVSRSDVFHVVHGNPKATFVGDLASAEHVPSVAFDCVILTQTLHLIYDLRGAMGTLERILKPGGVLLMTVPGTISQIEDGEWADSWKWGFTRASIRKLCEEVFPANNIDAQVYGNVLTSVAFLQGLAAGELTKEELAANDTQYPLLITIRAVKSQGDESASPRSSKTAAANFTTGGDK